VQHNQTRNVLLTTAEEAHQRETYNQASASLKNKLGTDWGIKGGVTFFEQVRGWSIINKIPHDPMHVFLEGVLKFEFYLVLHWLAKDLKLGVTAVDQMISKHQYLHEEKCDKPAKIAECHLEGSKPVHDGKIKQTAGMMIVLARNFVSIFGE
jgi:hypothetical protein